ncbi:hypothetical protein [Kitasatospora sp. NPDC058046]|uniref:hypothetical protein n=1 Tax=Kitasatospora sp. NPDC058046 TaxID=3346312 RepID=UPI0036D7B7D2
MRSTSTIARAAQVVIAAINTVFEDDTRITLAVIPARGGLAQAVGELGPEWEVGFDRLELGRLLDTIATALDDDAPAIVAVTVPDVTDDGAYGLWAWHLADGTALTRDEADMLLGEGDQYTGGEYPHPLRPDAVTDLITTSVDETARDMLTACLATAA